MIQATAVFARCRLDHPDLRRLACAWWSVFAGQIVFSLFSIQFTQTCLTAGGSQGISDRHAKSIGLLIITGGSFPFADHFQYLAQLQGHRNALRWFQQIHDRLIILNGGVIGIFLFGGITGFDKIFNFPGLIFAPAVMKGQQIQELGQLIRVGAFQESGDLLMEQRARGKGQVLVGHFLHKDMPEEISELRFGVIHA